MMKECFTVLALLALVIFWSVSGAEAGFDSYVATATIDSGTSSTTVVIPMEKVKLLDLLVFVPTLDSGTSGTIAMTQTVMSDLAAQSGVAIRGYSTKSYADTADNAVVQCNSSELSAAVDGNITITLAVTDNQAADRVFYIALLAEN